jgi:hypothetical protein
MIAHPSFLGKNREMPILLDPVYPAVPDLWSTTVFQCTGSNRQVFLLFYLNMKEDPSFEIMTF